MSEAVPRGTPGPLGAETMSPALQQARNYYAWIADQFRVGLGKRVLDVGGGHGSHLDHIVAPGRFVMSLDLSADCVGEMRKRFAGADFEARVGDISDPALAAELGSLRFDTIVCVNVLEHIEDDSAALRGMAEVLAPSKGRLQRRDVRWHPYGAFEVKYGPPSTYLRPIFTN